jgi:ABC-type amino acid transport substrate-binding protein
MKVTTKWSGPTPMLRLLQQLEAGEIDAAVILSKTPEREKLFVYPSQPFVQFQPSLAIMKDNHLATIQSVADLVGVRIGYQQGGVLPPLLKDPQVKLDLISSPTWLQDNFAKLFASSVDAVLDMGMESLIQMASRSGQGEKVRFVALPVPPVPIYSAFARTPRGSALAARYDVVNAQNAKVFKDAVQKFVASTK